MASAPYAPRRAGITVTASSARMAPASPTVPVTEVTLGTLPVKFEITSLLDVKKATKRGRILHRGDAGESEYALCYTIAIGHAQERIWLSSGELGGSEHSIENFYAAAGSNIASNSCPALPTSLRPVSLSNSLWLGQKGSHIILRNPKPPFRRMVVPDHKEVRPGTLHRIISDAGLTVEAFLRLLRR
jgi:hypothetical protein